MAGCLVTLFVESLDRWDDASILTMLLFGLVPMLPFLILVAAARVAITSKMRMATAVGQCNAVHYQRGPVLLGLLHRKGRIRLLDDFVPPKHHSVVLRFCGL